MASIGISDYSGPDWQNDNQVEGRFASPHVRTIRYTYAVLQEIRANALASFISIPRGGVEIGGVLFGTADAGVVSIRAHKPLSIEYLTGPSFLLSSNDELNLKRLIEESAADPEFAGLQAIGWYHSHTRSDVFLSEEDIAVHERFFPNPSQVALVIKPFKFEPAQVGIFVRDADFSLRGDVPYCRLTIQAPLPGAPQILDKGEGVVSPNLPPPVESRALELPRPAPRPALRPLPIDVIPDRARPAPRRMAAWVTAASLIVAAAIAFALTRPAPGPEPAPVHLHVSESGNQLTIAWNRESQSLVQARSAEITIIDGDRSTATVPLDNESLKRGSVTYVRRSGDVQVRMHVQLREGRAMEEITRFIGPDPAPPPAPPLEAKREEPDPELLRVRAELNRVNTELSRIRPENERSRSVQPAKPRAFTLPPSEITQYRDGRGSASPSQSLAVLKAPEISSSSPLNTPPFPMPAHISPPAPPIVVSQPQQQTPSAKTASGRAIWTGRLPRGGMLLIEGRRPSVGALSGPFPQRTARMRVYSADLGDSGIVIYTNGSRPNAVEAPSPGNGWNLTTYTFDPRRSRAFTVVEYPGPTNDWKRLLIRNDDRMISMLVIDWEDVAGSNK